MLQVRLKYPQVDPDDGPVMYVNLYDEEKIVIETLIRIAGNTNFIISRIYDGEFTQNIMGNSGKVNYNKLFDSGMMARDIKHIIHGQIALAVIDFIGIVTDLKLADGDIKLPIGITTRFIESNMDIFVEDCYKHLRKEWKKKAKK